MQESTLDTSSSDETIWTTTASTEPLQPFQIMDNAEDVPFLKRLKTRFLTYVRQNYLKIFYILLSVIGILSCLLILLIVSKSSESHVQVEPSSEAIHKIDLRENFSLIVNHSMSTEADQDDFKSVITLRCGKITCHTNKTLDCNVTSVTYESLKRYSCCRCMPGFRLIRVEYYPLLARYDMILSPNWTVVPDRISSFDVATWSNLPYLKGVWGVVSESPGSGYLKYSNVRVKRSP